MPWDEVGVSCVFRRRFTLDRNGPAAERDQLLPTRYGAGLKYEAPGTQGFQALFVVAGARSDRLHMKPRGMVIRMQFSG